MKFFQVLGDIWRHEELRKKIGITLGMILIYRIGSYIPIPGVNAGAIVGSSDGLEGLLGLFTGGAFTRASIFALGIMPYISASIIMQLMGVAVPSVQKLQKEGESGRNKINQWTRFLTIAITLVQAPGYLASTVVGQVDNPSTFWWISAVTILTCSTLLIMWLGERITEKGVGNGISLLIMIGIIATFPQSIVAEFELPYLLLYCRVRSIAGSDWCGVAVQALRKVPVQMAKMQQAGGVLPAGEGARSYIH